MIQNLIPPILADFYYKYIKKQQWQGAYSSWEEAKEKCTGYDADIIFEKVKYASLAVKEGRAVYERDSVLFDKIEYSWPLLSGLLLSAANSGGHLNVIDFGGSLGSSYFQNRKFLCCLKSVKWNVVEQNHFVEFGQKNLQTEELRFYYSIEKALESNTPSVLVFSSVLQYLEKPKELLQKINTFKIPYIIVDITPFSNCEKNLIVVQTVPSKIYEASYPCIIFSKERIVSILSNYTPIEFFETEFQAFINHKKVFFEGIIFKVNDIENEV